MTCNKNRILTEGFSELQAKMILVRGFSSEEKLLRDKDFATILKRPISTINYNKNILRKYGILTKLNFLTPDGKVVFQKLKRHLNKMKRLRGHKLSGFFILEVPFQDFETVRDKYLKISNSPKHRGFRLDFKDCVILFYSPTKVFFYIPDIYGDSIDEIYASAYEEYISPMKGYLEQEFKSLRINNYEIASVQINHLAYQNHPLAEIFKEFNVQYASDRIGIDHSNGVAELETIHEKYSVEDMDKILDYEKCVRYANEYKSNRNERRRS